MAHQSRRTWQGSACWWHGECSASSLRCGFSAGSENFNRPKKNMTEIQANEFAREWIAAWNSHDVERILSHYSDEIEFTSPFVVRMTGDPSGTIRDKATLTQYFRRAFTTFPDLCFDPICALAGVNSV